MANTDFDIISVGDATIDHFIIFHDATVNCQINKEICQLLINYGDKLPVDKYLSLVAGNAANNAVGSARLGLKSAFYVVMGDDESGRRIKRQLEVEGVDTRYVELVAGDETNNSFVLSFQGERTIFVYHVHHKYKLPTLAKTRWVYLTSTGAGFENMFEEVIDYTRKNGAKLAFNPGTYQLRGDVALLAKILKTAEVCFLNVEEAQHVLGTHDKNIRLLLTGIREMGVAISVITDAHNGAYCYDGEHFVNIAEFNHDRVETTGAGDAFGTGFVAALHYDQPVSEALRWASINANSVVQKIGPQAGLLTKRAIEQRLLANPDYLAQIMSDTKLAEKDTETRSSKLAPQAA